jgi:hypothetical protein
VTHIDNTISRDVTQCGPLGSPTLRRDVAHTSLQPRSNLGNAEALFFTETSENL